MKFRKLLIKEYAELKGVSEQAIYNSNRRGTITITNKDPEGKRNTVTILESEYKYLKDLKKLVSL